MPFQIIRDDITRVRCDAIVNAAKNSLLGGGGVDGAIHRAAGPGLLEECRGLGGCETGMAKITGAYDLPAKYVIHTVGPVWQGGEHGERELLASCYRQSLLLAEEYGCETVAFPLISAGVFGYPKDQALRVAADTITDFLSDHDITVYLVVFNRTAYTISTQLYDDIKTYIDDVYAEEHSDRKRRREQMLQEESENNSICYSIAADESAAPSDISAGASSPSVSAKKRKPLFSGDRKEMAATVSAPPVQIRPSASLDELIRLRDESFSQMLLRKIDERGMTDAQCYKKANIDRKLFSKIRGDVGYRPRKTTAIAFAIALELNLDETRELLMKAGYALSRSYVFDIIIEYCILHGIYNVYEINEALFAFDQSLLGA